MIGQVLKHVLDGCIVRDCVVYCMMYGKFSHVAHHITLKLLQYPIDFCIKKMTWINSFQKSLFICWLFGLFALN